jgi:nucleotide-binding universal stress UspA family protein
MQSNSEVCCSWADRFLGMGSALNPRSPPFQRTSCRLNVSWRMVVCVEELPRFPASVDEIVEVEIEAKKMFDEVILSSRKQAKAARVKLESHVIPGHAVSSIVEFVEREKFDLLIVGFMGHSALYNRLIGSTTDRLVELAPCQVLVVK